MSNSHRIYLQKMIKALSSLAEVSDFAKFRIIRDKDTLLFFSLLDLGPIESLLSSLYRSNAGGKQAYAPLVLFRSLLLMAQYNTTSYNRWTALLRGHPELQLLCGFPQGTSPAVATFYNFAARLLNGPYKPRHEQRHRPSDRYSNASLGFLRQLREEKEARHEDKKRAQEASGEAKLQEQVSVLLSQLHQGRPTDFTRVVEELLLRCAILPSAQKGLLGALDKLDVAGDSSLVETQASRFGRPACECAQPPKQERTCHCDRLYADPDATYGWDSGKEDWSFGYKVHAMVTHVGGRDLPLHISVAPAHTADAALGIEAIERLYKLFREHKADTTFAHGIFDRGYDYSAVYRLHLSLGISPVIPLRQLGRQKREAAGITFAEDGTPLCPAQVPMRHHAFNKQRGVHIYHCPAKRPTRAGGHFRYEPNLALCPRGQLCHPETKLSPVMTIRPSSDPRTYPPIRRGSDTFKKLYKKRTCCERFFSRLTSFGKLDRRPYRRQHLFTLYSLAHAIGCHVKAWCAAQFGDTTHWSLEQTLDAMAALLE